jgi:MraZ protein
MFIGKYYHTLEAKGRISLPKKFRGVSNSWIVTRGLDGGLFVFTETTFTNQVLTTSQRTFTQKAHRDFRRLMMNEASQSSLDTLGRLQLPEYLIEFAKLKKELVIVGSSDYLEIWDRDLYHTYVDQLETNAEQIAESFNDSLPKLGENQS